MKIKNAQLSWQKLANDYNLSSLQIEKFKLYANLLVGWNQKFNLTAITDLCDIIDYHFYDSLALSKFIDLNQVNTLADIGTGAGFPGLALKILQPNLNLILIEAQGKKVEFLQVVIEKLEMDRVLLEQTDWRTFLRTSTNQINLFCARASLELAELLRIFKPSSAYLNATLVYWASQRWWEDPDNLKLSPVRFDYRVGDRNLTLALFKNGPCKE